MHLMVGDYLHGVVRNGRVVLETCLCPHLIYGSGSLFTETRLPEFAAAFFPLAIPERR